MPSGDPAGRAACGSGRIGTDRELDPGEKLLRWQHLRIVEIDLAWWPNDLVPVLRDPTNQRVVRRCYLLVGSPMDGDSHGATLQLPPVDVAVSGEGATDRYADLDIAIETRITT